jgi:long-subunit fatty acid transport protein
MFVMTLGVVLALNADPAAANPEAGLFDSKSVGLAGTGVAHIDGPSAVVINPANMQGVDDWSAAFALTPIFADLGAPVEDPDETLHTGLKVAPTGLIGGAYRFHPRIVAGLAAYILTGYGGEFNDVETIQGQELFEPQDQQAALFVGEAAVPVSVRVTDDIDIGLAVRLPYARLDATVTQEILPNVLRPVQQRASGFGTPGVMVGATYRPADALTLGVAYRSKVTIDMTGITAISFTQADPLEVDTTTDWRVPHMVRFGFAAKTLQKKLMVTSELRIQFHGEANKTQIFRADLDGFEETIVPFNWNDVYSFMLAAEYQLGNGMPIRGGYSGSNSATSADAAQFFTPPAGLLHSLYLGTGISSGRWDFDFATSVNGGRAEIDPDPTLCQPGDQVKVGCPGKYTVMTGWLSFSATRR